MAMSFPAQSPLFSSCSLLMTLLFAYSASVQLDDPDWYFWLPLYAVASAVNLSQALSFQSKVLAQVSEFALWGGVFLLLKVVCEACHVDGVGGLWSMDMRERVVREKIGSGLVVISMILYLKATSHASKVPKRGKSEQAPTSLGYGMAILVAVSFGLSFYFFLSVKEQMRF
ncbi:uncharacterized protein LOC109721224 isoform X2 [Ananas comosus]|uniref:Uncharacterized protein LOC109721224 isoform X2 n=1 Tax=Ananas comosus TaxID=4615 RepID=A0A6P5GED8_ANACO|nr:uncharacterized protein LOC109721224 isoform X2 [Ananas comosus]